MNLHSEIVFQMLVQWFSLDICRFYCWQRLVRDFGRDKFGANCFILFVGYDDWDWEDDDELWIFFHFLPACSYGFW